MRVLMLSHLYPSQADSVYGSFVHSQVRALQALGCSVQVLAPTPWVPFPLARMQKKWQRWHATPAQDILDGVHVRYPRVVRLPKALLFHRAGPHYLRRLQRPLAHLHQNGPFTLVHAQVAYPDGWAALRLLPNHPLVLTVHGQEVQKIVHWSRILGQMVEDTLAQAAAVVVPSAKIQALAAQHGAALEKIHIIANGLDPLPPADLPREIAQPIAGKQVLLSVGRLEPEKGIEQNLRALAKLRHRHPDLVYLIVGDGSQAGHLRQLALSLDLEDKVIFAGHQPRDKVGAFYAHSHVFSLPSQDEAFGIVYLEAMAAGLPVVASLGEGIAPLVKEGTGLLVPPKDVMALTEAIHQLLDPDLCQRLGARGRALAEHYTWEANARQLLQLYRKITL